MEQKKIQGRYICVLIYHTRLCQRHYSPDLQTFAIHISCVGTTKLVLIYIIVGSMKKKQSEPTKQTHI